MLITIAATIRTSAEGGPCSAGNRHLLYTPPALCRQTLSVVPLLLHTKVGALFCKYSAPTHHPRTLCHHTLLSSKCRVVVSVCVDGRFSASTAQTEKRKLVLKKKKKHMHPFTRHAAVSQPRHTSGDAKHLTARHRGRKPTKNTRKKTFYTYLFT